MTVLDGTLRTSALSATKIEASSPEEFEALVVGFLDKTMKRVVSLSDLNRRFGVLAHAVCGRSLRAVLMDWEERGRVAVRFSEKRKVTYVYGPETWTIFREVQNETGDVSFLERHEDEIYPKTRRPSGAARRREGRP